MRNQPLSSLFHLLSLILLLTLLTGCGEVPSSYDNKDKPDDRVTRWFKYNSTLYEAKITDRLTNKVYDGVVSQSNMENGELMFYDPEKKEIISLTPPFLIEYKEVYQVQ